MAAPYPVTFDAEQPERYNRPQAALRLVILILLSLVGSVLGWLFGVVYLVVPVAAAILVQQAGASGYLARETDRVSGWLRWLVAVYAWLLFLTDRFPVPSAEPGVSFGITPGGSPTTGSALLRLVTEYLRAGYCSCSSGSCPGSPGSSRLRDRARLRERAPLAVRLPARRRALARAPARLPRLARRGVPAVLARHGPGSVAGARHATTASPTCILRIVKGFARVRPLAAIGVLALVLAATACGSDEVAGDTSPGTTADPGDDRDPARDGHGAGRDRRDGNRGAGRDDHRLRLPPARGEGRGRPPPGRTAGDRRDGRARGARAGPDPRGDRRGARHVDPRGHDPEWALDRRRSRDGRPLG